MRNIAREAYVRNGEALRRISKEAPPVYKCTCYDKYRKHIDNLPPNTLTHDIVTGAVEQYFTCDVTCGKKYGGKITTGQLEN